MKPVIHMSGRWIVFIALALTWAGAISAQAQTPGTGTIQGRVFNPGSKEYVRNAEVRLEGSNRVTYTENDGTFQFNNVPAGAASVSVTFTGYNTATESFTVTAGQTAVREINLTSSAETGKDGVVQLGAFTVSSEREGNAKAIMEQRRNMNITTSVSSDIFGDVTDGNVGEFLKYLPGVDLDYVESEPRGPRLGGMDGQYVGVSFDGMRTANADANRGGGAASRATSFEGFSITSIDSIEINWTASPENDADSPAGIVNMKTKRAFDRKGRRVGYNFGLNFNSEDFTWKKTDGPADYKEEKWKPNFQLDYSESFFNQRFGLLLSASQSNSYTEQIISSVGYNTTPLPHDPRPMVVRQIDMKDGPKWVHKDALLLTADWKATQRLTLSLNMVYSYYDGEFWNRNFTWVAANDNANVNVANGRSSVGGDGVTTVIATRVPSGSTTTSQTNTVATLNNGGGSSAKLTYSRQIAPRFEYKLGGWIIDGAAGYSYSKNNYESIERGFSNNEGGGVPSSFIATRSSPRATEWTIRQTSGNDWFDLRSFNNTDVRSGGTRITNDDRTWITEKWTGLANARWVVPFMERFPTTIKFGGKWDEETRNNNNHTDVNIWAYTGPGGNTTTVSPTTGANQNVTFGNWANVGPQYISSNPFEMGRTDSLTVFNINGAQGMPPRASRNEIARLFRSHPEQWTYMGTPENWYTAYIVNDRYLRQTVIAGYTQADIRLTRRLQTRIGVRMEETETKTKEFNPRTRAEVLAAGFPANAPGTSAGRPITIAGMEYAYLSQPKLVREAKYHNYFPSIVAKYQIMQNFDWQMGFNKAIGRPSIDDLTGVWSIDENAQRVTLSNPSLLPEYHKKFQSRLAYYFSGRSPGQLTLSLSQVASENFVQQFDLTPAQFGIDDPDLQTYTFRTRVNSPVSVRYRNLDFAYNQTLGFLASEYLRGISVGFNYSRSYADQRRTNLAPHRVSGRFGYAYKRFSGTIGFIWADDKPESGTYGRYFSEITKADLTLNWRLNQFATLYVQGRNISNMRDRWYQSPPGEEEGVNGYQRSMEEYGANWVFGVKGSF
jgi:iron complex outermembrane receptor protein